MIVRITQACVRRYGDSGQITAYVAWIDHTGHAGTTEGDPEGTHMRALLGRAQREGVPCSVETWDVGGANQS